MMAQDDDLNTSTIALVGFVGAVVVFAVILLLTIVFYRVESRQQQEKDVSQPYARVSKLKADQQGRLASYGWIDEKNRVAFIPVGRAKDLVVAELSRDPHADVTGAPPAAATEPEPTKPPGEPEPPGGPGVPPQEEKEQRDATQPS